MSSLPWFCPKCRTYAVRVLGAGVAFDSNTLQQGTDGGRDEVSGNDFVTNYTFKHLVPIKARELNQLLFVLRT